jgi:homoserine kinase
LKAACEAGGALGSGISGSGPSVFALSRGMSTANKVAQAMQCVFEKTNIPFDIHISPIKKTGVSFIEDLR